MALKEVSRIPGNIYGPGRTKAMTTNPAASAASQSRLERERQGSKISQWSRCVIPDFLYAALDRAAGAPFF
jgi:hypothetical protein